MYAERTMKHQPDASNAQSLTIGQQGVEGR